MAFCFPFIGKICDILSQFSAVSIKPVYNYLEEEKARRLAAFALAAKEKKAKQDKERREREEAERLKRVSIRGWITNV